MDATARNLAIARKFYEGYSRAAERGGLVGVFDPADFADGWVFCSPYLGGEITPDAAELAAGADANHKTIWKRIPDYRMDRFDAWPNEDGCAWRWFVNGHGRNGEHYAFWETLFIRTDEHGKVTRFEFFDDWHGFPQTLAYAYDVPLDALTGIEGYGQAPFLAPAPTVIAEPPAARRPQGTNAARNLALAERWYDGYHHMAERQHLVGPFDPADFAPEWVMSSGWGGDHAMTSEVDWSAIGDREHHKIWQRIPDYRMDHFAAWPTDDGCAWRWRVGGTSVDGAAYEFWEQVFVRTNDEGKIVRLEFFDDWKGFPQTLGHITGLPLDVLWDASAYQAWIAADT